MAGEQELTHFRQDGASRMVDVGGKAVTARRARAAAVVRMQPETLQLIRDRKLAKGDVFEVARLAGILAAKRTGDLIPLCHPLGLDRVEVDFAVLDESRLGIEAVVEVRARTGVEMEALTAVSLAALTLYDMCKSVDRDMTIESIRLLEKTGGKSGTYRREEGTASPSSPATSPGTETNPGAEKAFDTKTTHGTESNAT